MKKQCTWCDLWEPEISFLNYNRDKVDLSKSYVNFIGYGDVTAKGGNGFSHTYGSAGGGGGGVALYYHVCLCCSNCMSIIIDEIKLMISM